MTTAQDLDYDEEDTGTQPDAAAAAKAAAYAERQQKREAERQELADLRRFKADADRKEQMDAAKAALNFEGPLGAFLRTYTGEPTADAIKAAVEADPDFKTLVTFTPDIADAAAAVAADNARNLAGGSTQPGQIDQKTVHGWDDERKRAFRTNHPDLWKQMLSEPEKQFPAPAGLTL